MSFTPHVPSRIALFAAAAGLLLVPLTGCGAADAPEASAGTPSPTRSAQTAHAPDSPKAPAPTRVTVPSVGIDSTLMRLGLNQDGTVEVPPAEKGMTAGWYAGGAVPGEPGAAVLIGHNDTRFGRAVFHDLHKIAKGADITVSDGAGEESHFTVTAKETVKKDGFPTEKVYGATGERVLRLITCDGDFDAEGHPVDNLIVYATLR
ncbi:class F sortase [Streptomyces flavovirens]|uniref:class F sortase n=1 Tax=Streptomyces TaxID=1883 RepID=UPI000DACB291|nr:MULTISPECIES: class F sortase [unclassified Streptomyces]MYU31719.1 class F sortase [Streptomyces sp. SID8358]MYX74161.1 class F sortase [Streptomyces sp. SID3915]